MLSELATLETNIRKLHVSILIIIKTVEVSFNEVLSFFLFCFYDA